MPFLKSLPEDAKMMHLWMRWQEASRPLAEFTEVILRGPSPLSTAERELIAAYTSGVNACQYCHGTHTATAEALGVEPGVLGELLADLDGAPVDAKLKPILRYARILTLTPTRVTQADVDAILAAGWDDDAFYHAVSIIALFNYYNRMMEGFGIHGTAPERQAGGQRLATMGYTALFDRVGAQFVGKAD